MEEKRNFFPNWSTSEKIKRAERVQCYAEAKLKTAELWTALSRATSVGTLGGALVLVATGVGVIPGAIFAGAGLAASATVAVVQKIRSHKIRKVLAYSESELELLKKIEFYELPEPFEEFVANQTGLSSMTYVDFLKSGHAVFFDPLGEDAENIDEVEEEARLYEVEHIDELSRQPGTLYSMFYEDEAYENYINSDENVPEEEIFSESGDIQGDCGQSDDVYTDFPEEKEENQTKNKKKFSKTFTKHDRTK